MDSISMGHRLAAGFCLLSLLLSAAYARGSEATYVSFQVPGGSGTHPMSINNAMAITGYYYASPTLVRGFVHAADGTFSTFEVAGSALTVPAGINDAGEVTGFYLQDMQIASEPEGFIRYADGRVVLFNPPCYDACNTSTPLSINDYGEVAGSYPYYYNYSAAGFSRTRQGSFDTYITELNNGYSVAATSINDSGTVTGFYSNGNLSIESFIEDARGYVTDGIAAPAPGSTGPFTFLQTTSAQGINAEGSIVGWYQGCNLPCAQVVGLTTGAFVRSPQGNFSEFNLPGIVAIPPQTGYGAYFYKGTPFITAAHLLSINEQGGVAGSYTDRAGLQHGFVRNPYGTITSFDPPKGYQTTATSINDSGVITGTYVYIGSNSTSAGFLRIPQQNP